VEAFVEQLALVSAPGFVEVFVEVFVVLLADFVGRHFVARRPQPAPTSAAATIPASRKAQPA